MKRFIYILVFFVLVSCDKDQYFYKDGIKFYYSDNISTENGEKISSLIAKEIGLNENQEIKDIKEMKIDSGYFTIVLTIPMTSPVNGTTRGKLRSFAQGLSVARLNETPVHIVVTDDNYNPIGYLTYKSRPYWDKYEFQSGNTMINLSDKCEVCWASNLDLILRSQMPELFRNNDSLKINVDVIRDTVIIDVAIDPKINVDSLTTQFQDTNSGMYLTTFNSRTTIISIIDRKTNKQIVNYAIQGRP